MMENMTANLTSPSEDDVFASQTLFDINYDLACVYVALVIFLTVLGVFGNSFILYVMSKERRVKGQSRSFTMNMAIADLCVAGIADPMCIVGAVLGKEQLYNVRWLCTAIACLCLTACICVFLNLVNITVNRWMYICHNHIYDRIYNRFTTILMCIFCWITGFMAEVPNFFGWGGHFFDDKNHQCIWDRTASRSYTLFVALGLISSPFVVIIACHIAMFRKIYKSKKDINAFSRERHVIVRALSSAKTLLTMCIVFIICWTPYVSQLIFDHSDNHSMETYLFITLLAHAHSSTPCLIYFIFIKRYRDLLRRMCGMSNSIEPSSQPPTVSHRPTEKTTTTLPPTVSPIPTANTT